MRLIPISESVLRKAIAEGVTARILALQLGVGYSTVTRKARKLGLALPTIPPRKSAQTRAKLSIIRSKYLLDHPSNHPWRKAGKFHSLPCTLVKNWLCDKHIDFVAEYGYGFKGRAFAIDIAFPEKMVGIEINGNQHYNNDGSLKPYYRERHTIIESTGWRLIELHYSIAFNLDDFKRVYTAEVACLPDVVQFDYANYSNPKIGDSTQDRTETTALEEPCDIQFHHGAKPYKPRYRSRRILRPDLSLLRMLIASVPLLKIGAYYNVSDNSVRRWCVYYNLIIPKGVKNMSMHETLPIDFQI